MIPRKKLTKRGKSGKRGKKGKMNSPISLWKSRLAAVRSWSHGAKRRNKLVSGKENFSILFKCSRFSPFSRFSAFSAFCKLFSRNQNFHILFKKSGKTGKRGKKGKREWRICFDFYIPKENDEICLDCNTVVINGRRS